MRDQIDAFWMLPDPTVITTETIESMMLFSIENRKPILTFADKYLELGATVSVSADLSAMGEQAAELAQRILTGTDIQSIPPEKPITIIATKEDAMEAVTISPKFQVVIPRRVRESMNLKPGQKMQVIEYGNRIELVPEKDIAEMRGFLKGINKDFEREADRA